MNIHIVFLAMRCIKPSLQVELAASLALPIQLNSIL